MTGCKACKLFYESFILEALYFMTVALTNVPQKNNTLL